MEEVSDEFIELATNVFDAIASALEGYEEETGVLTLKDQNILVRVSSRALGGKDIVGTNCIRPHGPGIRVKKYLRYTGDIVVTVFNLGDGGTQPSPSFIFVDEAIKRMAKDLQSILGNAHDATVDWPAGDDQSLGVAFTSNPGDFILAEVMPWLKGRLTKEQVW